jgi:hypothetical protein
MQVIIIIIITITNILLQPTALSFLIFLVSVTLVPAFPFRCNHAFRTVVTLLHKVLDVVKLIEATVDQSLLY